MNNNIKENANSILDRLEVRENTLCSKGIDKYSKVDDQPVYSPHLDNDVSISSSAMRVLLKSITDNNSIIEIGKLIEDEFGIPMTDEMILRGKYMRVAQ